MSDDIIAEIRQLLTELVLPDLRALTYKVDGIQNQSDLNQKSMVAQLDAIRVEMGACRSELAAFRAEMRSGLQSPIHDRITSREDRPS